MEQRVDGVEVGDIFALEMPYAGLPSQNWGHPRNYHHNNRNRTSQKLGIKIEVSVTGNGSQHIQIDKNRNELDYSTLVPSQE